MVVVSALKDVTDQLIESSQKARSGDKRFVQTFLGRLKEKHLTTARKAIENKPVQREAEQEIKELINELEKVLTGIIYLGELTPKSKDYVLSFGEKLSAPIVWGALRSLGLKAQHFTGKEAGIVTDSNFGEARPLLEITKQQARKNLNPY